VHSSADFRFVPRATNLLRSNEMTQWAKSGSQKRMFTMGERLAAMVIRARPPHKEPQSYDFELRVSGQEKLVQNEKRET
jgi:hypothetical protein